MNSFQLFHFTQLHLIMVVAVGHSVHSVIDIIDQESGICFRKEVQQTLCYWFQKSSINSELSAFTTTLKSHHQWNPDISIHRGNG